MQGSRRAIVRRAEADFDEIIAIYLKGPWLKIHAALRAIIPSGRSGAIVNTSSFLPTAARLGTSAYSASKAGIDPMDRRHRPGDRAARYPRQQSMDAPRRKVFWCRRRHWMRRSIRPVAGAVRLLALMVIRCL
ncbi:SDR family NAD(P)-dependent oxidoreductase [Geminicoccus sp.]|uniref:SDR family NAD(P)-dependent oxidoreductase n=1 Tax=Geminicoccus sp. TaxID=2024832 RepID=UPI0039C85EE5